MKNITSLNRSDFSTQVNAEGYQILYKGQKIGGAGIVGKFKGRGRMQQIKDYSEMAERDICYLLEGSGYGYMIENITRINKSKENTNLSSALKNTLHIINNKLDCTELTNEQNTEIEQAKNLLNA